MYNTIGISKLQGRISVQTSGFFAKNTTGKTRNYAMLLFLPHNVWAHTGHAPLKKKNDNDYRALPLGSWCRV